MDARQRRSREKLRGALFTLASERPANELTVSELASLAGVNRSTFYEHATSPQTLLEELLGAELDSLRQRYLVGIERADAGRAIADTTRAVLQHIDEHAAIYRFGLRDDSGAASLHAMLSSHFEASIRMLVEAKVVTIHDSGAAPDGDPGDGVAGTSTADTGLADAVLAEYAARYISSGTVGVITAWINGPEPRDVDAVLHSYQQLLPAWWPLS